MGQQHLGLPGSLHTVGLWSRWELSAAPVLTPGQLCSALFPLLPQLHFVCELSVCIFVQPCLSGALEGQKKLMDLLELELQMIVSCYVGAGN